MFIGSENKRSSVTFTYFHSARNHWKYIIRRNKRTIAKKKCSDLLAFLNAENFYPLGKYIYLDTSINMFFPPLIHFDETVANTLAEKNSYFNLLFHLITLWKILASVLLLFLSGVPRIHVFCCDYTTKSTCHVSLGSSKHKTNVKLKLST